MISRMYYKIPKNIFRLRQTNAVVPSRRETVAISIALIFHEIKLSSLLFTTFINDTTARKSKNFKFTVVFYQIDFYLFL